tara:strand:- start:95 stop:364 length:270 start_codon:yes stop_codon:yes gene_type:complete
MGIDDYIRNQSVNKQSPQTVSELANMLSVTRQTVYNWMNGVYKPHWKHVVGLVQLSSGKITKTSSAAKDQSIFDAARQFTSTQEQLADV